MTAQDLLIKAAKVLEIEIQGPEFHQGTIKHVISILHDVLKLLDKEDL